MAETQQLLREVLELPAVERANLVDQLLASLDRPDPEIDAVWRKEVEARIDAYEAGRIETVSMEEVLAKHLTR